MVRTNTKKATKIVDTPINEVASPAPVINEVASPAPAPVINEVASQKVKKVVKSKKVPEPNVIPVVDPINTVVVETTEVVKAKRGRKSKKELLASLSTNSTPTSATSINNETVQLKINEIVVTNVNLETNNIQTVDDNLENNVVTSVGKIEEEAYDDLEDDVNVNPDKPVIKKRGRKPKGGKIIQQVVPLNNQKIERPNIILHLKCSMKDLQSTSSASCLIESFNFGNKNELSYELLNSGNITTNDNKPTQHLTNDNDYDDDDDNTNKDNTKEIWRKLKQLEHNLHINNINNKKSACFWCTCDFDNPPIYIPKHFINKSYHVYGCFCSPECGVAHLMNEPIDSSAKHERYHLLNHIYSKIYEYKKNVKPAPNPYYMLEKFYGNLSIQEYRSLLRNERLFLIVDKPLTRILPELHEDNEEIVLNVYGGNNKTQNTSGIYKVKRESEKQKGPSKTSIMRDKFGLA
jgi:hypothetical protein